MRVSLIMAVLLVVNGCSNKGDELFTQAQSYIEKEQRDQALPLLESASESGNAEAALLLGKWYEEGIEVEVDVVRSTQLYRQAAEMDNTEAIYKLSESYISGRGVELNRDTAYALMEECAEMKDMKCMARLIMLKRNANSTPEEIAESLEIGRELALTDYSKLDDEKDKVIVLTARINFARLCLQGRDMDVDSVESLKWTLIYNENKSGMNTKTQTNMFDNIRMTYDHISKDKIAEAKARAERDLGHPLKNYDNLFILEEPEFD